ncbi:hypothetical protein HAX54_011657 [Datura stramonium]|uniref:Uncharacterized protein n=1 Tax=Datura stramonium TaxID=4076 RepID=A0ABS8Y533_DATST|nr:hypothetical protein [Datura stramonium]
MRVSGVEGRRGRERGERRSRSREEMRSGVGRKRRKTGQRGNRNGGRSAARVGNDGVWWYSERDEKRGRRWWIRRFRS